MAGRGCFNALKIEKIYKLYIIIFTSKRHDFSINEIIVVNLKKKDARDVLIYVKFVIFNTLNVQLERNQTNTFISVKSIRLFLWHEIEIHFLLPSSPNPL